MKREMKDRWFCVADTECCGPTLEDCVDRYVLALAPEDRKGLIAVEEYERNEWAEEDIDRMAVHTADDLLLNMRDADELGSDDCEAGAPSVALKEAVRTAIRVALRYDHVPSYGTETGYVENIDIGEWVALHGRFQQK
jgi:hypothetical protein